MKLITLDQAFILWMLAGRHVGLDFGAYCDLCKLNGWRIQ